MNTGMGQPWLDLTLYRQLTPDERHTIDDWLRRNSLLRLGVVAIAILDPTHVCVEHYADYVLGRWRSATTSTTVATVGPIPDDVRALFRGGT